MSDPVLRLTIESELPDELAVGRGSALFVCGWCFCAEAAIESLAFVVDGGEQSVAAHSMPRLDPFRALHPSLDPYATADVVSDPDSAEDPGLRSYRSGFWGLVRVTPRPPGQLAIGLRARLAGGGVAQAPVGTVAIVAPEPPLPLPPGAAGDVAEPATDEPAAMPLVVICMAAYSPAPELIAEQVRSIREQTYRNWRCVISDDCSSRAGAEAIAGAVGGDPRFTISRSPRRLGFYRNFERALTLAPAEAELVALSDQDDRWHPDKLATLVAALGDAQLVYSDARVVTRDGDVIADTWWERRRNNHSDLLSLLVANSVTGAASLLRRELLADALPFPPAQFAHFHDHWLALVALSLGEIAYVDRPLYDYVQHGEASLGHAAANQMSSLRDRLRSVKPLHERVRLWRLHYFVDIWRLRQFTAILQLRLGDRIATATLRELRRFEAGDESALELARLAARGVRELVAARPETLGAEWMLAHALAWRRLVRVTARDRPRKGLRLDALPPPTLIQQPGATGMHVSAREIVDKIAPLRWHVGDDEPERINILIPTIDLRHFFGGYIAKFNLAAKLVAAGERVRIVTVDPVGPLPADWRETIESYGGLHGLFQRVEVAFGRESSAIAVARGDRFVASTWWTAHIANDATRTVGSERFLYLIQEYEPFTFPMGTYAALAAESYGFPHFALFSSELLRDYFRRHRIGVFAAGTDAGDDASASFQNAITAVPPPTASQLRARDTRRLLFYARPEPHAARNMFDLGVIALSRALAEGAFRGGWELHGIGTVQRGRRIELGGGATLELLPRADQAAYGQMLRDHDVGLSLMYTPHPSLVPLEMASAGVLTVTTTFENKDADALHALSANLIAAEPTLDGVTRGLLEAAAGVDDVERRVAGAATHWSRDWDTSLGPELIARVRAALAPRAARVR
ncbi:MAG TPA: glycosyltransferase [Solirubrobacteraceae bacterium]|nr:glycosyltransferase [Solirubrobacteraceae bacterium]